MSNGLTGYCSYYGNIALTAATATARVVFHEEMQAAEFFRDWHEHSTELWTQQNKIVR